MLSLEKKHQIIKFATPFLDLAKEQGLLTQIDQEIISLQTYLAEITEGFSGIAFRTFAKKQQLSMILKICQELNLSNLLTNLIQIVIKNNYNEVMIGLIKDWQEVYFEYQGYKKIEIITAIDLTKSQEDELKIVLTKEFGEKFFITKQVNKEFLGGIVVKVGEWLFDDSLKTKINSLNKVMKGTKK